MFGVFEVGMNKNGEIDDLTKLIRPHIGIITNIGEAHIENFNNVKGIAEAKSEIINNIQKQNGYVFITVAVIITILISSLTIAISNQNKNIDLIQFYENSNVMEEEISAIELVITEYLNSNFKNYNNLLVNSSF